MTPIWSNNPQQCVFGKFTIRHSVHTRKQLFVFFSEILARGWRSFPFCQLDKHLIFLYSTASPSLFILWDALSANPPEQRLFSFALVPVAAAPDATAASQEDKSLPGVNRVCPPRLRWLSASKGGRFSSSFEPLPSSFRCFLLLVLSQREMTIAAKYRTDEWRSGVCLLLPFTFRCCRCICKCHWENTRVYMRVQERFREYRTRKYRISIFEKYVSVCDLTHKKVLVIVYFVPKEYWFLRYEKYRKRDTIKIVLIKCLQGWLKTSIANTFEDSYLGHRVRVSNIFTKIGLTMRLGLPGDRFSCFFLSVQKWSGMVVDTCSCCMLQWLVSSDI